MLIYATPTPAFNIAEELPWLKGREKQSVRLHPRRVLTELPLSVSKAGGNILWPKMKDWPSCSEHNLPYVSVLQLAKEDFPELAFPGSTDLMQLLWCPRDHEECGYAPCSTVYWQESTSIANPRESNPYVNPAALDQEEGDYIATECSLHPERVVEYPSAFALNDEELALIEEWAWEANIDSVIYQHELSTASGTKLGGYPDWIQDPEIPVCDCGIEMEYLLTIDSAEWDGGSCERWCVLDDRWAIDRRANYEERDVVQRPMGLMLGDMGSIYVFICRKCEPWRSKSIMQCS